ncbi:glycoside hydrolase family 73 protein [Limnohabitans sp. Hippo4]|uniref:glycoside hydrolase family 73 protein n=1 Tax=Limnohabitans sp. Hippo4 TaxID=1826167 RepID=UPI000D3ACFED|nr:glycoside hydrolase family 73 protein [Limnohabitans sp. Hippo4]PUE33222.1 mannosyl-glycoprotein endo-beta-N-acetylglucosamidase [Limnohabitans sp. Hippo4]
MSPTEFIMRLSTAAITSAKTSGVPASITIAQAALESAWGESVLARNGNNLFGIKADSMWRGHTLTLNTKEFIKGQWVVVPALWRKYPSWQASIDDHAAFLKRNPRYKACFACTTAQAFATALSQAGYATDPAYADKVVGLIKQHNLLAFDGGAP